uniref:RING-type domain-containing protein n=1 Tax=Acrobeloides nanus TaxID=290746 RepID=A0A914E9H0_9BILA
MKATAPMVEEHAQSTTSSQPTRKNDESMDENLCCICLENKPEIVLIPCGHAKFCQGCADMFKECPICRSTVVMKQRIFL